jgi:very-long-chain (3R)-3-hydroxyacyl-CoA dehydratase
MAEPKSPSLGMKDLYLIFYNGFCCIGWAYVLFIGIPSFFAAVASSDAPLVDALKAAGSSVYFATPATAGFGDEVSPSLATVLFYVQSAALLEVVHAAIGLVRSPVFVTTMQVGSRIVALHMISSSPKAQSEYASLILLYYSFTFEQANISVYTFVLSSLQHNGELL